MTRNRFGGDAAAWLFDTIGHAVVVPDPGQTVTAWSGPHGDPSRVQYDDLRALDDAGTVLEVIPVLADASVPEFDGPNDASVTRLWMSADGGVTGVWLSTTTISKAGASGSYADLSNKPAIPDSPDDIGALPSSYTPPTASQSTAGILPIASSAEATAGSDNTKAMTAVRVKQLIDALWSQIVNGAAVDRDSFGELAAIIASDESGLAAVSAALGTKVNTSTYTAALAAIRDLSDTALAASLSAAFAARLEAAAYTYNADGTIATETVGGFTTTYGYNADGSVHTATRNGVTMTYTYDASGNVTAVA